LSFVGHRTGGYYLLVVEFLEALGLCHCEGEFRLTPV
jgi:hypothetical protein